MLSEYREGSRQGTTPSNNRPQMGLPQEPSEDLPEGEVQGVGAAVWHFCCGLPSPALN